MNSNSSIESLLDMRFSTWRIHDSPSDSQAGYSSRGSLPNGRGVRHVKSGHFDLRYICARRGEFSAESVDDSGSEVPSEGQACHLSFYEWRAVAGRQLRSKADARKVSRAADAGRNAATRA